MIDLETKKKIIALHREGKSKKSINEITGVSVPTIRKVINEHDMNDDLYEENDSQEIADIFHVNLLRNYPYGGNGPYMVLRNGLPIWDLGRVLSMVYPEKIVNRIVDFVSLQETYQGIYQVKVFDWLTGSEKIEVKKVVN